MPNLDKKIEEAVKIALEEDSARRDTTTALLVPRTLRGRASILSRARGVISGQVCAETVFRLLDAKVDYRPLIRDGGRVDEESVVALLRGPLAAILSGERTALNFLAHLSGIATVTSKFVERLRDTGVTILDTRKTVPGLRQLEKQAVIDGGGKNHRNNLEEYILVKENHLRAAGGIRRAASLLGKSLPAAEIEVTSLEELRALRKNRPARLMLDNFDPEEIKRALQEIGSWEGSPVQIEVSGGINLENVSRFALPGVDYISVGAITAAAGTLDLSLQVEEVDD
ncbi:MAG: carboxylating nicotinate-nucleotide diphosphorylase [Candidatus Krumholzibacteriota bacterium]|nr:carboxylating nicotinate-nucleotide diphosphorylase [Candidatus Krumholzibacteriota bacterium]